MTHILFTYKSCQQYFQNISRMQPLLTTSTATVLVQTVIIFSGLLQQSPHWSPCFHFCSPSCSVYSQQSSQSNPVKCKSDHITRFLKHQISQSKIQSSYHKPKTLRDLVSHCFSAMFSLFTLFQPHWPPCCSLTMPARHASGSLHLLFPQLGKLFWDLCGSLPHSGCCSNATLTEKLSSGILPKSDTSLSHLSTLSIPYHA